MKFFYKSLLYCFLVLLLILSGRDYFYSSDAVFEADYETKEILNHEFFVYYTTNDYEQFSSVCVSSGLIDPEKRKIFAHIPAEKIKRIRIVYNDWIKLGEKGRYVNCASLNEPHRLQNPKIRDGADIKVDTEDISLVRLDERLPSTTPCMLKGKHINDGVSYELKKQPLFGKHFFSLRFVQVIVMSLLCAGVVMWTIYAEPLKKRNKRRFFIYSVLSGLALSINFTVNPVFCYYESFFKQCYVWLTYLSDSWRDCDFVHLALCFPLYLLYCKADEILEQREKSSVSAKALAVLFALFILVGRSYELIGSYRLIVGFEYAQSVKTALAFSGYFLFIYTLLLLLFRLIGKVSEKVTCSSENYEFKIRPWLPLQWYFAALAKRPFKTAFCTIVAFYIPFLILKFPCSMYCDGYLQAIQIHAGEHLENVLVGGSSQDIHLNAHHPLMHTLLIIALLKCGLLVGDAYMGLFFYSCVQLMIVASSVAYSVHALIKYTSIHAKYASLIVIYFLLHPMIHDYMFMVTKDVIYASALLAYISLMFVYIRTIGANNQSLKQVKWQFYVSLTAITVLITFSRNEGGLIIMIFALIALAFCFKLSKPLCYSAIVALGAMFLVSGLVRELDVQPGRKSEMFSLPCQQIARTLREHDEVFTQTDRDAIKTIFNNYDIAYLYSSGCSDSVKFKFQESDDNARKFFKLWLKGMVSVPQTYLEAFIHNYYLYTFPDSNLVSCKIGHTNNNMNINLGSRLNSTWANNYMESSQNIITAFSGLREKLLSFPFFNLVLIAATYFWWLCIILAFVVRWRCKDGFVLMLLPICIALLPFLGPTNGDYGRYTYPLMVCLPFLSFAALYFVRDKLEKING